MSEKHKRSRTVVLFATMGAIYGNFWNSQFAVEELMRAAIKIWDDALSKYNDAEIGFAINKCINNEQKPPNLPRFLQLCEIDVHDLGIPSAEECLVTQNDLYQTLLSKLSTWDVRHFTRQELSATFKALHAQYIREELEEVNKPENKIAFITSKIKTAKNRVTTQHSIEHFIELSKNY